MENPIQILENPKNSHHEAVDGIFNEKVVIFKKFHCDKCMIPKFTEVFTKHFKKPEHPEIEKRKVEVRNSGRSTAAIGKTISLRRHFEREYNYGRPISL